MKLDLKLHPYVCLKAGVRVAFYSNLPCAADTVYRRPRFADSVMFLPTGQTWTRQECRTISLDKFLVGLAA